jgi:hypothetical protein
MPVYAEDDTIPGRAMPPECHAEAHTDYAGAAVRWGLTHHVGSAADCCQACLNQAKNAKPEEKKCNIWVYCPREGGCHSPDKYSHENHECWLKQVSPSSLNLFKLSEIQNYRIFFLFHGNSLTWVLFMGQADEPVLNFKDRYSDEYRQRHPAAPSVVPWVSGVVS